MSTKLLLAAFVFAAVSGGAALAGERNRDFNAFWDDGVAPIGRHCHVGRSVPDCAPQAGVYPDNRHIVFEGG